MLAVQLSDGLIMLYSVSPPNLGHFSSNARIAYLSSRQEVTLIDFEVGNKNQLQDTESDQHLESTSIINIDMKPSVIAVGPSLLAVACNNLVRFYHTSYSEDPTGSGREVLPSREAELEYANVVSSLALNSRFVAVLFKDARLKLHPIQPALIRVAANTSLIGEVEEDDFQFAVSERYFPDPTEPEKLTGFALTEELLVYCTNELCITVFSLREWAAIQTYDCSQMSSLPIEMFKSNHQGNKFVCLTKGDTASSASNVCLYDLYTNNMISFKAFDLYERIYQSQLIETMKLIPFECDFLNYWTRDDFEDNKVGFAANLENIEDAIWSTDGRTIILSGRKMLHLFGVIDHTICVKSTIVKYAASYRKPADYKILYASKGIISCLTSSGGLVNLVEENQNHELNLSRLDQAIQNVRSELNESLNDGVGSGDKTIQILEAHAKVMQHKLAYLRTILPVSSLARCKEICLQVTSAVEFNIEIGRVPEADERQQRLCQSIKLIDRLIWRQLAAWAIYKSNLDFALLIYRKHRLMVHAQILANILDGLRHKGADSKVVIESQLFKLLNCKPD